MIDPIYVTEVAERKPTYPWTLLGHYIYPPKILGRSKGIKWNNDHHDLRCLMVHKDKKEEAKKIAMNFYRMDPDDIETEKKIIAELEAICEIPLDKMSSLQRWESCALQLPGDIGGPSKSEIKKILTDKAKGKVLEVMCGFNSYFGESPNVNEVIALDFSRAMLERYPYPERKRILYDLERVVNGEKLGFFSEKEFQTIGCCFGFNYLSNPIPVFSEFHRILSNNGKFLILENTDAGYEHLVKRYFKPEECTQVLEEAGFSIEVEHLKWLKTDYEWGEYYLIEGTK